MEVEIWTDEIKGRCTFCKRILRNDKALKVSEKKPQKHIVGSVLKELAQLACQLGASDARAIYTTEISVEDDLAKLCQEPGCENYGLSAGCPPHVAGPAGSLLKKQKMF